MLSVGFGTFHFPVRRCSGARTEVVRAKHHEEGKRQKQLEDSTIADARKRMYGQRSNETGKEAEFWQSILRHITALDTHGTTKPEAVSWAEHCHTAIVPFQDGFEIPDELGRKDTSFDDMLSLVSTRAASAKANHKRLGNALNMLVRDAHSREQRLQKKEVDTKRKLLDHIDDASRLEARSVNLTLG